VLIGACIPTLPANYRIRFHNERGNFEVGTLLLFSVVYFFVSCVTYGIAVPSGLFVPCILTGMMSSSVFSIIIPLTTCLERFSSREPVLTIRCGDIILMPRRCVGPDDRHAV
jgi:H+/Cl- antiporter ClcA